MKAVLEFNLDDPDDKQQFDYAILGPRSHLCLWEMWNRLHRTVNRDAPGDDDVMQQAAYWLAQLLDIMDDNDVPLDI